MKILIISILITVLSACAIYSHDTMVWTYVLEGGLDYYQKGKESEDSYFYDVHIWEKSSKPSDLHSYQTNTTELRIKTAQILLSSKYHTGCQKVDFVNESFYQDNGQYKKGFNGTWWKMRVICNKPTNPRKNKYS